jgi:hypothetical protein
MLSEYHVAVAREHVKDLLREAQQERYIHAAQLARRRSNGPYRSALAWLGGRLVAWGWRLRARHGAIEFWEETIEPLSR